MQQVIGWYQPHHVVAEDGTLVDQYTGQVYTPEARTKQEFVAECDINNVVKQYMQTGQITHINAMAQQGAYEDLPPPMDFQEALNTVMAAEDSFATLPSRVRDRFANDPERFLAFMADPDNADEALALGLRQPPKDPPPQDPPPEPPPGA